MEIVGIAGVWGGFIALIAALVVLARADRPIAFVLTLLGTVLLFFKAVFPGVMWGAGDSAVVVPGIAMLVTGRELPLPVPAVALGVYLGLTMVGSLIVLSSDEALLARSLEPVLAFLRGDDARPSRRLLRSASLFLLFPLLCGWLVLDHHRIDLNPPVESRQAHPSISYDEDLVNPYREPSPALLTSFLAERNVQVPADPGEAPALFDKEALRAGRDLYAANCRPCHGIRADGTGPMGRGFRLRPADFTDPGTISVLVEPYAFQRIREGGVGLPPNGSPWDSAMPRWKDSLTDDQIWLILLGEYSVAGVNPRVPEKH